jgi:hypothetical protein
VNDWIAIAQGVGLDLSPVELAKLAAPLSPLEARLAALVESLPPELEPAAEFRACEEGE